MFLLLTAASSHATGCGGCRGPHRLMSAAVAQCRGENRLEEVSIPLPPSVLVDTVPCPSCPVPRPQEPVGVCLKVHVQHCSEALQVVQEDKKRDRETTGEEEGRQANVCVYPSFLLPPSTQTIMPVKKRYMHKLESSSHHDHHKPRSELTDRSHDIIDSQPSLSSRDHFDPGYRPQKGRHRSSHRQTRK